MDKPTFISSFIYYFVSTFVLWWFVWAGASYVHPHSAHLAVAFCTTPERGAVTHYVVQTALFNGFGYVHACIMMFTTSSDS